MREAADDFDSELDTGGELLDSSQIGYDASSRETEPATSIQAQPSAVAAAPEMTGSSASAAVQKLPAEELEGAEESRVTSASKDLVDAGAAPGEGAGAAGNNAVVEAVQSMSAALEEPLSGKAEVMPTGGVQAAAAAGAQERSGAAAPEPVQEPLMPGFESSRPA